MCRLKKKRENKKNVEDMEKILREIIEITKNLPKFRENEFEAFEKNLSFFV